MYFSESCRSFKYLFDSLHVWPDSGQGIHLQRPRFVPTVFCLVFCQVIVIIDIQTSHQQSHPFQILHTSCVYIIQGFVCKFIACLLTKVCVLAVFING